jgi:hypothetical protein
VLATRESSTFTSVVVATSLHGGENRPELHASGSKLWVDWIDAEGEMTWTKQDGPGWEPVQIEPFESLIERDFHVRGEIQALATQ